MLGSIRSWLFYRYKVPSLREWKLRGVRLDVCEMSRRMKEVIISANYETAEALICDEVVNENDRVLEIGGAIGFVGLYCLINRRAKSVVSVEANPDTAERLRRCYALNGLAPKLIVAALWEREEPVGFASSNEFWTDGISVEGNSNCSFNVPGKPLEQLFLEAGGDANVLIVDVEGAEQFVDWGNLPSAIEKIIIELHPEISGPGRSFRTLKALMDRGFDVTCRKGDVFALSRVSV